MKLAEVVAKFLESQGLKHIFGVNGGANLHLIHGVCDVTKIQFIPTAHEQGAGFAADSYARLNGLGCAMATSGPGATNLVTAIAASFYDSVPVLYITGQVATFRQGSRYGVKFYGFQETPIVEMVRDITKYAGKITDPSQVLRQLDYAVWMAQEGRKGPVLVDIPDDLQRTEVDEKTLLRWHPEVPVEVPARVDVELFNMIIRAERPVFVWGAGMRPYAKYALKLAEYLDIPVATTWGAIDLIHFDHPLHVGGFGTHGTRAANFAVQNADLLICIGARLDTKATGNPVHFARGAKLVMVDIDGAEIAKFEKLGRTIDFGFECDAGDFINALSSWAAEYHSLNTGNEDEWDYPGKWIERIWKWKKDYASKDDPVWRGTKPYELMQDLAQYTAPDDIIVSDTGTALGYLMQGFPFKGERFIHAFNLTPMGYGLPASVGAAFATGRRVILITGDGSIMMSLSELATIRRWDLNIKIILLNNGQHSMCVQTEKQWFNGRNAATTPASGLGFPDDFDMVANGFGIPSVTNLIDLFALSGFRFYNVSVDANANLACQARFGAPIEDMEPLLPRDELNSQMEAA